MTITVMKTTTLKFINQALDQITLRENMMQIPPNSKYYMMKLGIKRGNFFQHLEEKEIDWLTTEASNMKTDIGVVVASIIKDVYYEEEGEKVRDEQKVIPFKRPEV